MEARNNNKKKKQHKIETRRYQPSTCRACDQQIGWVSLPDLDVHMINAWASDYDADREIMLEKL